MKKQKVDTKLGVAIIVVFAITVGALVWIYGNSNSGSIQQNQTNDVMQQKNQTQNQQNNTQTENQQNQAQQNDGKTENQQSQAQNELTEADKNKLVQAFIVYIKTLDDSKHPEKSSYLNKNLYVRINKNTENYLNGTMLIVGSENISAPYFLAFKQGANWKVVFNGQDIPDCNLVEPLNFPSEIVAKCYDAQSNQEKVIL